MLQDLLQQRGIIARLEGAGLQGAAGELPVTGLVRLLVNDDDLAAARAVIDEWEKTAVPDPIQPPSRRPAGALVGALIGLVLGIGAAYIYFRVPANVDGIDYNEDRVLDERWNYSPDGTLVRTEIDRNFDGDVDLIWIFDRHGQIVSGESDDDFDGVFESRSRFRNGQAYLTEVDTNGDSIPDLRSFFKHGVLISAEYISKDSGNPVRVEVFRLGKLASAEIDTDGDGTLDRRYLYDDVGGIASVEEPGVSR